MNWKFWQSADGDTGNGSLIGRVAGGLIGIYLVIVLIFAWWWDYEPDLFDARVNALEHAQANDRELVTGYGDLYQLQPQQLLELERGLSSTFA